MKLDFRTDGIYLLFRECEVGPLDLCAVEEWLDHAAMMESQR